MKTYIPILMGVAAVIAIALSLVMTSGLHDFCHRSTFFSTPEPGASKVEAPVLTFDDLLDDLVDAIEWVESKGDPWAVGDGGKAVGSFQLWEIYVDDVNRINKLAWAGRRFSYSQRYDPKVSRTMVKIFLKHYGGTFEEMARKHNGGPQGHKKESTKAYWLKVKARMESAK